MHNFAVMNHLYNSWFDRKLIKGNLSFDDSLEIVKKKKITYAPDTTMQAMFSDRTGRVLIIEPGIGYRLGKRKIFLNNKLLHSKTRIELIHMFYLGITDMKRQRIYCKDMEKTSLFPTPLMYLGQYVRKDFGQPEFLLYIPLLKIRYIMCWTMISKILQSINSNITAIINKSGGFTFPPLP